MHETTLWAVVPVKRIDQAKQRLSPILSSQQRQNLALAMLQDVLQALIAVRRLAGVAVVTEDTDVMSYAERSGCRIITEGANTGHTGAVTAAGRILGAEGAGGILTIPGDVPLVTSREIDHLLDAHLGVPGFTIVPTLDDKGSNAVLLTPPDAVPLRFGEDSFFPHLAAAQACGITPQVVRLTGCGCDIDTPADVERFMGLHGDGNTRAFRFLQPILSRA